MATATVTSKGRITLPKAVREHLRVGEGDRVEFVTDPGGEVRVTVRGRSLESLRGLLRCDRRRAVTPAQMDAAVLRVTAYTVED